MICLARPMSFTRDEIGFESNWPIHKWFSYLPIWNGYQQEEV